MILSNMADEAFAVGGFLSLFLFSLSISLCAPSSLSHSPISVLQAHWAQPADMLQHDH